MSAGPETYLLQILDEMVVISERIRRSVLAYRNYQNLSASDGLRCRLETIRVSIDTILDAFTRAPLTNNTLDDRMIRWLCSGKLPLCSEKLKELEDMVKPIGQVQPVDRASARPLRPAEDKLVAAMAFFDEHQSLFDFLLTPDAWNCKNLIHRSPHVTPPIPDSTHKGHQEVQTSSVYVKTETPIPENGINSAASECDTGTGYYSVSGPSFTEQKLDEVLRWLSPLSCIKKHNHTLQLRQEGTSKWFPETDVYKRWRVGGNFFLWLHGKAGCGKSVLVSSMIEHLKNTLLDEEVITFFYCDFRNERSTRPTEVMRSLLSQLLGHIRDRCIDPGKLPSKILEQKDEGILSLDNLDKLCDLVLRVARCFSRYEPIIVIDALDECVDIKVLLRAIVQLNQGDVRLLVTSRSDQIIMDHFAGLHSFSFQDAVKQIAADIASHIRFEVDSHSQSISINAEMKEEIRTRLNEKADGRFRWVQCQLDILKRCATWPELRLALENLPNELEATYEKILEAINERESEGKLARHTLVWLAVALEPLRLAQVIDWFLVDVKQQKMAHETQSLGDALLYALSSLVSYYKETDVLVFSHFSVKEYLTSHVALSTYHIASHIAHADVAQICMSSISIFLKQKPTFGNDRSLLSFPMLSYVLSSGFNHLAHVDPRSTAIIEALQSLGEDVRHHPSNWECLCELREEHLQGPYPPWPSSRHDFVLYILIAYSPPEFLQSFLSIHHALKPRVGTNPFVYAADLRKTKHAMALLACGVDVNTCELVVDGSHHISPLEVAIDLGDDVVVGELLQRGCAVTSELLATAICNPWCSTRVLVKLMQTDSFLEWAREIGDERLYRGVFNSARPNSGDSRKTDEDHVAMACILHKIGRNLSADSQFAAGLIERAFHAAHTSMLEFLLPSDQPPPSRFLLAAATGDTHESVLVVDFLLRRGVDIHAVSVESNDTALHLAVMCPWEPRRLKLIEMLIRAGCDPMARNSYGETIFEIAIGRGYTSVVECLLSYNFQFPPDSNILPLALQKCASPRVVEYLLRSGASIHSITSSGDTVLHLSVTKYEELECLDLMKKFVLAGCNLMTRNYNGITPLTAATERGYSSVVGYLQSHTRFPLDILSFALQKRAPRQVVEYFLHELGANVHSTTSSGDTVLHLAVTKYDESACLELVKQFIERGRNPETRNYERQTVIGTAAKRGFTSVVKFLRSCNVQFPPDILLLALRGSSSIQMVEYLIDEGADIHITEPNGITILRLAVENYDEPVCLDLVKMFILAGHDDPGPGAEAASRRGYFSVLQFLQSCNDQPSMEIVTEGTS